MTDQPKPRKRARVVVSLDALRQALLLPDGVEVVDVQRLMPSDVYNGTLSFYLAGPGLPDEATVPAGAPPLAEPIELFLEYKRESYWRFRRLAVPEPLPPNPRLDAQLTEIFARRGEKPTTDG